MKNKHLLIVLSLLISFLSFGQNKADLNRVDSLIKIRQPNAAKEKLWSVIDEAVEKEDNKTLIAAFPYFKNFLNTLNYEERKSLFYKISEKSKAFPEPSQTIIHLHITEEALNAYYSWFGHNHNTTEDSTNLGNRKIRYDFILQNIQHLEEKLTGLQQFDFKPYKKALYITNDSLHLYRTLSDYVAYHLIDIYRSSDVKNGGALKDASSDQEEWYATTDQFQKLHFENNTLSTLILELYQKIEKNNTNHPLYLSTAIYQRLYYLKDVFKNEQVIENAWEKEFKYFEDFSARSKFRFEIEKNKYKKGKKYHYKDNPEVEKLNKKAHEGLTAEIKKFPKSDFKNEIKALIKVIEHKEVDFSYPQITPPKQKIPLLIKHKNYSNQVLRIYKIKEYDPLKDESLRKYVKEQRLTLIRTLNLDFKNKQLFQNRSTELLLDGIESSGQYYFIASEENKNLLENSKSDSLWNALNIVSSQITIATISASSTAAGNQYTVLVVDQKTGKPIQNAEVSFYKNNYRSNSRRQHLKTKTTNKKGLSSIRNNSEGYNRLTYVIKYKGSVLDANGYIDRNREEKKSSVVKLFTDRAIYRPGQTINFKSIAFEGKENNFEVFPNKKLTIILYNASYQEIFKKSYTTNSFGSVNGSIVLPEHSGLGNFTMEGKIIGSSYFDVVGRKSIGVEEYKRPTFEVALNQPKEEAKLEDTVAITGNAKAFAGFPISDAKVTYSVYRRWTRYWRFYNAPSSGDLLKEGTLTTDEDGNFDIDFFAAMDPNAVENANYYYTIEAKVTDLSGETHEQKLSLNLTKTGLSLQFSMPKQIMAKDTVVSKINVVNMAGEKQAGFKGKAQIYKVVPAKKFLNRIWKNAETSRFGDEELSKLFPYMKLDAFADDENQKELIKTLNFQSGDSLNINKELEGKQGRFTFKLSSITEDGDTLKTERTVEIIDVESKQLPTSHSLWTYVSSSKVEVGSAVDFQVGSSFKNAKAIISFYRDRELISREWVDLKNRYSKCYTVKEKDRGVLTYKVVLFHNGVFYSRFETIKVPFTNKKLAIKATTFRDLLEPGQKEQWSFQIKDNKNQLVKSELAATMYDASLDQIQSNYWTLFPYYSNGNRSTWNMNWSRRLKAMHSSNINWKLLNLLNRNKYKSNLGYRNRYSRNRLAKKEQASVAIKNSEAVLSEAVEFQDDAAEPMQEQKSHDQSLDSDKVEEEEPKKTEPPRTNFNETAFFYPTLYVDDSNEYVMNFTLPESLTQWKLLLLAHTKDLKTGTLQKEIEARKELMVTANAPRFVRQGDQIHFSAKVVNLTEENQTVDVALKLENPIEEIDLNWTDEELVQSVMISGNSSKEVSWKLDIGQQELMQYTISASSASFSDGERNIIPVLSNRIAVTETDHALFKGSGEKTYTFDAFKNQSSSTLQNTSYTVEYIDNLAWQAVMALPYLNEMNNQSSTELINSFYANAISEHIVSSHPKIKTIFEQWKSKSPDALMSELEKNKELKNILLNETPWVMDAKNETEQRRRIAQLFELNQLHSNQRSILNKLEERQNADGGFSWFSGGRSNVYITNLILNRFGQLEQLGVKKSAEQKIVRSAEKYLAKKQVKKYKDYFNNNPKNKSRKYLIKHYPFTDLDAYWLYSRTFYHRENSAQLDTIIKLYKNKMKTNWVDFTPYGQALAGIYFKHQGMDEKADLIYASFQDRAKKSSDLGMYWVENSGYRWYQNKIGVQAMAIAFFQEMEAPKSTMDELRLWLILNKETQAWETGVNTADAIFAILMSGRDYLKSSQKPAIQIGNNKLVNHTPESEDEIQVDWTPGLGQMKQKWTGGEIQPELGTVTVNKNTESPAVLNLYWQYTEELSQVRASQNKSMKIHKTYRRVVPGAKDEKGIIDSTFNRGDKIEIELKVTVDRDLEFVHIKDLRPAGFEPKLSVSGYHWENKLSYYQSPKDVSMDYFISHMSKGTYKLTYTVFATHSGKFNCGAASVQCFYAPKYSGNSTTQDINIK